jgi:hypothetical protein
VIDTKSSEEGESPRRHGVSGEGGNGGDGGGMEGACEEFRR